MKLIARIYIVIALSTLGFLFFQSCFDFELKLYETGLTSYFISGIVARILLSLYFVLSVFWLLGKANRIIKLLSAILFFIPLYFFLFDSLQNEIIVNYMAFNVTKWIQVPLILLGLISLFFASKSGREFLPQKLWIKLTKYLFATGLVVLVFVINPLFLDEFTDESQAFVTTEILQGDLGEIAKKTELRAYFSTSCQYCEMASKKLMLLQKKYSGFPEVKLYFFGSQEGVNWFLEDTKTEFEYEIMETEKFLKITSGSFPKFISIKDSSANLLYSGRTFNYLSPQIISRK